MKTRDMLLGIMGAAATGAALGILFAPNKGSETRKKIADKGKDYTNKIGDKLAEVPDTISSMTSKTATNP